MWISLRFAVWSAGGEAIRFSTDRVPDVHLDGLILGGGEDVDPTLYGEELLPTEEKERAPLKPRISRPLSVLALPLAWTWRQIVEQFDPAHIAPTRDSLELHLLSRALADKMPVLGICRGQQLMNVYLGGTLHQDLKAAFGGSVHRKTILPLKNIEIVGDSQLGALLGPTNHSVNGLHRQAVSRLGRGMRAVAVDPNGVIEAIEHESYPFLIGVQWHPELLPYYPSQQNIFRKLVKEAGDARDRRMSAGGSGGP